MFNIWNSWLWTCVLPTCLSIVMFTAGFFYAPYSQVQIMPVLLVVWGLISISVTFLLNSLASFVLVKQNRITQLGAGIVLAIAVPVVIVWIDHL